MSATLENIPQTTAPPSPTVPPSTTANLYTVFNKTFEDLITALAKSFGQKIPEILTIVTEIHEHLVISLQTTEIFTKYQPFFTPDILAGINTRDALLLYGDPTNQFIVDIGGKYVYDDLFARKEQGFLWSSLQTLATHMAIINATGPTLSMFENLAQTFVQSNPTLDPTEYHSALFSQLFTNPALTSQLLTAFEKPETIQQIFKNVGPVLSSLAPSTTEPQDDDEGEEGEDSDPENSEPLPKDEKSDEEQDNRPSRVFAREKKNRMNRRKKQRRRERKKKKSPFTDLVNMVNNVELNPEELKSLHAGIRDTLGDNTASSADGFSGLNIGSMMSKLASGDTAAVQEILQAASNNNTSDGEDGAGSEDPAFSSQLGTMLSGISSLLNTDPTNSADAQATLKQLSQTMPVDGATQDLMASMFAGMAQTSDDENKCSTTENVPPSLPPIPDDDCF